MPPQFGSMMRPFVSRLPCVYVLSLGHAGVLRDKWDWPEINKLPPSMVIAKYGRTCDLRRRLTEHHKKYKTFDVTYVAPIDPAFAVEAEFAMEELFDKLGLLLPGPRELAMLPAEPLLARILSRELGIIGDFYSSRGQRDDLLRRYLV